MARSGSDAGAWRVTPLGGEAKSVYRCDDTDNIVLGSPALQAFPGGRLVAAFDQAGPGVKKLHGTKGRDPASRHWLQGRVLSSTDHGETWQLCETFPFSHPCLFRDGPALYVVGHRGDLQIVKSMDGGASWSRPSALTSGGHYSHSPTSVLACGDYVYMAVLMQTTTDYRGDPVSVFAAEVWRALRGADLTEARSWTRSEPSRAFRDLFKLGRVGGFGLPFYRVPDPNADRELAARRRATRIGWQEPHLVHIADPGHIWHRPDRQCLHLLASARTNRTNFATLCRVSDRAGEDIRIEFERAPAGTPLWMLPLPGGHLRFALFFDEPSGLFWLVSNRSTYSMARLSTCDDAHTGLPGDERRSLQLSVSRDLVDWQFAGLIAAETDETLSCYEPAVSVRGNDLYVAARRAEQDRRNTEDTNEIALFTVPDFRDLAC